MNNTGNITSTEKLQQQAQDWLDNKIFSHYLTVDLPMSVQHYNYDKAQIVLRNIVKRYEKELVGRHWNKHPVHFVGFAEQGEHKIWHWHLLLWAFQYTNNELQSALVKTTNYMNLDNNTLDIRPINRTPWILNNYNIKELKADGKLRFDSDRIFTSDMIFYL